jgi:hypothetical protein
MIAKPRVRAAMLAATAPTPSQATTSPRCPPIDAAVTWEASRMTPLEPMREGSIDALTAALMRSEAEKNARLHQAVKAYERCRRRRPPE